MWFCHCCIYSAPPVVYWLTPIAQNPVSPYDFLHKAVSHMGTWLHALCSWKNPKKTRQEIIALRLFRWCHNIHFLNVGAISNKYMGQKDRLKQSNPKKNPELDFIFLLSPLSLLTVLPSIIRKSPIFLQCRTNFSPSLTRSNDLFPRCQLLA